jgi:hypothetical protein
MLDEADLKHLQLSKAVSLYHEAFSFTNFIQVFSAFVKLPSRCSVSVTTSEEFEISAVSQCLKLRDRCHQVAQTKRVSVQNPRKQR